MSYKSKGIYMIEKNNRTMCYCCMRVEVNTVLLPCVLGT